MDTRAVHRSVSESNARVWVAGGWVGPWVFRAEQSPWVVSIVHLGLVVDRNGQSIEFVSGGCEGSLNPK